MLSLRTTAIRCKRIGSLLAPVAALVVLGGCGTATPNDQDRSYHQAGEDLIEGTFAEQVGFGALLAECKGRNLQPADTMTCTATGSDQLQRPIEFEGTINLDGSTVDVVSVNLLLAPQVERVETLATAIVTPRLNWAATTPVECGNTSIVVEPDRTLRCALTDPNGAPYPVTVTVDDFATLTITVDIDLP